MARYNKIYAGPVTETLPQVQEAPAASGGILPGTFITVGATAAYATTDVHAKLYVAQDNYLTMDGVDTAIPAGETVIGMEMADNQFFNIRVPTGVNVARGAAICVGASGKAKLALAADFVVAFAEEAYNNTSGADQLVRMRAAKGFYLPA